MNEIVIRELMNRMGEDRTERETKLMGRDCFWTSQRKTVHEQQMGTGDIISYSHEWYLPFNFSHYPSYFINEIKWLNLVHAI